MVQGGAQRLYNGNTLICEGTSGTFTEVDSNGNNMWKYISPVSAFGITMQGSNPTMNSCFRVTFIPSQYSGLAGQVLIPGGPIELNPLNYTCVNYATPIEEILAESVGKFDVHHLAAYPNPFQNNFYIHIPVEVSHATLQIHDVTGRLLYEETDFNGGPRSDVLISFSHYKGVIILSLKDAANIYNVTSVGY
jgi:hypothetical protein